MESNLAKTERHLVAKTDVPQNPMSLIASLCERSNVTTEGVAAIEQLVKLQEHMEDRTAKRDFFAAFAALQATMPKVKATREVHNSASKGGGVRYTFAAFEDIMDEVKSHLDKHGFALRFSTNYTTTTPYRVEVTCTLMHTGGHSESNVFAAKIGDGPPGSSGAQADGAAATYAKRFALCQALNIVVEGLDDDARAVGNTALVTQDQEEHIRQRVLDTGSDLKAFLKVFSITKLSDLPADRYHYALELLDKKERQNERDRKVPS